MRAVPGVGTGRGASRITRFSGDLKAEMTMAFIVLVELPDMANAGEGFRWCVDRVMAGFS
jgi:hypothetical protein